jgi:outer membrane protein OmpA-like peptidoglycan-associated protein
MPSASKVRNPQKPKSTFWPHAIIWVLAIAGGTVAAKFAYPELIRNLDHDRKNFQDRVKDYEASWQEAIHDPGRFPPPSVDEVVKQAPLGKQESLRLLCEGISKANMESYDKASLEMIEKLEARFQLEWDDRFNAFGDTPTPAEFCKSVDGYHHKALTEKLKSIDDRKKARLPRIRLALDSFSGYCVLRSKAFHDRVVEKRHILHLMDDGADYEKRIKELEKGEVQLAVFTLDALLINSALLREVPASVIMVLDESQGADAVITFNKVLDQPQDLNRPDLDVILTPNSPSEMLFRLLQQHHHVPKRFVPKNVKQIEDVYQKLKDAKPNSPTAFVLWEPYVTRALRDVKNTKKLIGSDDPSCRGYIIDVLVANKKWLQDPDHRREAQDIMQAYQDTLAEFTRESKLIANIQDDGRRLVERKLLSEPIRLDEAEEIAKHIQWKSLDDNFAQFGLLSGQKKPLEETIGKITTVLVDTGAMTRDRADKLPASLLIDKELLIALRESAIKQANTVPPISFTSVSVSIAASNDEVLKNLAAKLAKEPQWNVEVRGNMDPKFAGQGDRDLAKKRADAVAKWLIDNGVAEKRLKVIVAEPAQGSGKANVTFQLTEAPK